MPASSTGLAVISKTRLAKLPLTAIFAGPGPRMEMAFPMGIGAVKKMVPLTGTANTIVSPGALDATASRNEPGGPSGARMVTVRTAAGRGRTLWRAQQARVKVFKFMVWLVLSEYFAWEIHQIVKVAS
jgi:hypothetical protein